MNPCLTILQKEKEFQELIDAHSCIITPEKELKCDSNYELIEKLARQQTKSYSVFDLNANRYTFHSSAYKKHLPIVVIQPDDTDNRQHIYELTHSDDLYKVLENELRGYYFLQDLPPEDKKDFQLIYMRRLMDKNRGFQLYLHKVSVMEFDTTGEPWLLLISTEQVPECFINLSRITDFYLLFPLSHPNRKKREIFINNTWLTEQELNILRLVYNGQEQQEIADHLYVTVNTVKTHFTTIRKKMNIKTIQLSAIFAKTIGVLMQIILLYMEWREEINEIIA